MKTRLLAWTSVAVVNIFVGLILASASSGHPAIEVVDSIWKHLGGKARWEKCRYLEFTWTSELDNQVRATRKHTWDRYNGDYVLEFTGGDDTFKVFFNIDSKEGVGFKNGSKLTGEAHAQIMDRSYAIFCNDTYWLLAPTKLEDPGIRIQYIGHTGERDADGSEGEFIVLHAWFEENVGVTPGDEYWFHVTHDGLVAGWRYRLEGGSEGEWEWVDEKECGMGITLSTRKVSGNRAIAFPSVKLSDTIDRSVFDPPSDT